MARARRAAPLAQLKRAFRVLVDHHPDGRKESRRQGSGTNATVNAIRHRLVQPAAPFDVPVLRRADGTFSRSPRANFCSPFQPAANQRFFACPEGFLDHFRCVMVDGVLTLYSISLGGGPAALPTVAESREFKCHERDCGCVLIPPPPEDEPDDGGSDEDEAMAGGAPGRGGAPLGGGGGDEDEVEGEEGEEGEGDGGRRGDIEFAGPVDGDRSGEIIGECRDCEGPIVDGNKYLLCPCHPEVMLCALCAHSTDDIATKNTAGVKEAVKALSGGKLFRLTTKHALVKK